MRPDQFNYDKYHERCEEANNKAKLFKQGDFLPVAQWTLGDGVYANQCRDRKNTTVDA